MITAAKTTLLALGALIPLALASPGLAKSNGKSGNSKIRLEAEFEPPALLGVDEDAEGEARYDEKIHKGVSKTKRFNAKVRVPISATSPLGIIDQTAAQNADVQLVLSHVGIAGAASYATCVLQLAEIEEELQDGLPVQMAVYKVDVRSELRGQGQRERQIHGGCDIDVATVDVQTGTPVVTAGDTIEAVLFTAPVPPSTVPTATPIVSGLFATKF